MPAVPRSRLVRLVLSLAVVTAVTSCAPAAPESAPSPSPSAVDRFAAYERLNASVADIAEEQATLSPPMAQLLSAFRAIDRAVANLRDPERIDAAVDAWPPVTQELDDAPLEDVRRAARELAADVDATRIELARTRSSLDDDWEAAYLDAQDLVLQRVRAYAEASDALAQVLALHLPTYRQVLEETNSFVDRRSFYRSAEEASDAYEVEIGRLLDDLASARQQIAQYVEERDEAALDVNAATAAASDVWQQRPEARPSPEVSPP